MAIKIFFCYAHEDEDLLRKLKTHLSPLKRAGLIDIWHDRDISAGTEWEEEIGKQLENAQIILLLVSPDFVASDYCYSKEMQRALERHERGDARVIPIILRPVYWEVTPLNKLQALPTNAKPVMSSSWKSLDEAFFDVINGILIVLLELISKSLEDAGQPEKAKEIRKLGEEIRRNIEGNTLPIRPSASSSDEIEVYRCKIKQLNIVSNYGYTSTKFGNCECIVTNRRIKFFLRLGGYRQVYLSDLKAVNIRKTTSLPYDTDYDVLLAGYGWVRCNSEREQETLAIKIQDAMHM
jgi:hypothetical protein